MVKNVWCFFIIIMILYVHLHVEKIIIPEIKKEDCVLLNILKKVTPFPW